MKRVLILFVFVLFFFSSVFISAAPIIADHNAVLEFDQIPQQYIDLAKANLRISYNHQSHGMQPLTGMLMLSQELGSNYSYSYMNQCPAGDMCDQLTTGTCDSNTFICDFYDGFVTPFWNNGQVIFNLTQYQILTQNMLDNNYANRNVVMWMWCTDMDGTTSQELLDYYLNVTAQFEANYPNITFVYFTARLNGGGLDGNINQRNEQIRQHVLAEENRVLFDFADIERYNLSGYDFLDLGAGCSNGDACMYRADNGMGACTENWCVDYCADNPGYCQSFCNSYTCKIAPQCSALPFWYEEDDCAHSAQSNCLKCYEKGKAMWWLFARIAGWSGVSGSSNYDTNSDGSINIIDLALATYWQGKNVNTEPRYSHLDLNKDGVVNWQDVWQIIIRI